MKARASLREWLLGALLALPLLAPILLSEWVSSWGWFGTAATALAMMCYVTWLGFLVWNDDPWGLGGDNRTKTDEKTPADGDRGGMVE
jgi:hypothetical protein